MGDVACNFNIQPTEGRVGQPAITQGFSQVTAHCKERRKNLITAQQDDYWSRKFCCFHHYLAVIPQGSKVTIFYCWEGRKVCRKSAAVFLIIYKNQYNHATVSPPITPRVVFYQPPPSSVLLYSGTAAVSCISKREKTRPRCLGNLAPVLFSVVASEQKTRSENTLSKLRPGVELILHKTFM